jgi:hypothetical protein
MDEAEVPKQMIRADGDGTGYSEQHHSSSRRTGLTCVEDRKLKTLCSMILRGLGFRVVEATSPDEAAAMIEAESPAVLVAGSEAQLHTGLLQVCEERNVQRVHVDVQQPISSLVLLLESGSAPQA